MPEVIFTGPAGRLEGRYQPSKEKSAPIAIVPEIGAPGMAVTWVHDIRTWPAPRPAGLRHAE